MTRCHSYTRDVLLTALPESTPESHLQSDSVTKLTPDEETEVPPPPGTEPLLPIPALVRENSPERERSERSDPVSRDKKERDNEYSSSGERQSRERRRSFSRDGHRDR